MAYTATKYLSARPNAFPNGIDNTQRTVMIRGLLVENDTPTEYSLGGVGSTSFEVTAFNAVGLVTYTALKGLPLVNGQLVVVYNTASNTNDGTYIVSAVTSTTFVALPGPTAISGSAQTSQTAEGVGQIQFCIRGSIAQAFTVASVTAASTTVSYTYTTLTGPQIQPGQNITIAGCTNAGNNGTFSVVSVTTTSATAGTIVAQSTTGVATDSGTGTGNLLVGLDSINFTNPPAQVTVFSSKGYDYRWNYTNQTIQVFLTGASSGAALSEAALGATLTFDGTLRFEAIFSRT